MLRPSFMTVILALTLGGPGWSQDPQNLDAPQAVGEEADSARPGREPLWSSPQQQEPSMASDLWLYLHEERRHDDPKQAIRRKAEAKAAERGQRLAAMQWYGLSNQRPNASSVPFMGTYSPSWVGTVNRPSTWAGIYRRPFLSPISDSPDVRTGR